MIKDLVNRAFYEAIVSFEDDEAAQDLYYRVMDTEVERNGRTETVRDVILRVYCMLFCDDLDVEPGQIAGPDEVEATADRIYIGKPGFDPQHWYRMKHHFPVIDDDNYDRFAALVIADLSAGPVREAVIESGDMLLVGAADPLHLTRRERKRQHVRKIVYGGIGQ